MNGHNGHNTFSAHFSPMNCMIGVKNTTGQLYLEIFHRVSKGLYCVSKVASFDGAGVANAHLVIHAVISAKYKQDSDKCCKIHIYPEI